MKIIFLIATLTLIFICLSPGMVLAGPAPVGGIGSVTAPTGQDLDIANILTLVLNIIWQVSVTVTIIFFLLAGFKFLTAKGDPHELGVARNFVIWGSLGVIIIILAFSIIAIIKNTFNLT
ncbi:MAG: hypothetical protein FJZ43_03420 [Candidatus Staskawiczbacteria bacterium]|nr:hypothetical protein [Candidatus Staskawiczbacteria bacterium]